MEPEYSILGRTFAALPRLRICVVTETYLPEVNGVAITLDRCVRAMRERGHQVLVVRPDQPGVPSHEDEVITRGFPLPGYPGLKMGLPAPRKLRALWTEWRPDLVHIITEGPLGLSALSLAETMRLPVVADFHTNFHSYGQHYGWGWFSKVIYRYLRHFHNRAQLTLVPTRGMRERLEADGFRRLEVVARGVDTDLFTPKKREAALRLRWGLGPDDLAVLYVGRMAAEKNLPLVIKSFEAMKQAEPRAKLILVGNGPLLEALKRDRPEFVYAGVQRGEALARHFASADVFLFPSVTETFGNVTLEAMASGLAVLAYNYAAAAEHIVSGESGYAVPFDDSEAFIKAAYQLAASPLLRARLRHGATEVCAALSWSRVMDELEAALNRTIHPERPNILPTAPSP